MKFLYVVMFCVACFTSIIIYSCKSEPERIEVIQNYGTGEVSRKFITINGKKEGLMTDYYPNGDLKGERWFKNDIQVGKTILYHKNGKIKEVQYFEDGKVHGGDTIFYEDGKPEILVTFNRGIKDGYVRKWSRDGKLIYEARYSNDTLVEVQGEQIRRDSL